ncbi:GIY-YIG nuclease family protein [Terasakiella sp.]|uniref:GIY-YIG nuclease family protein n=1 Tax=Terasakiella sp. TaxID=2034861 RepID=UPI003AA90CDD
MVDENKPNPCRDIWGITQEDPGWIYIIKNGDLYKIGKTTNPKKRIQEARTWVPDLEVLAVKPFWQVSVVEQHIHQGLAQYWYDREWFRIVDEGIYESVIETFQDFYDDNRDSNAINFIYWYNGSGMPDLLSLRHQRKESIREFQRNASWEKRKK